MAHIYQARQRKSDGRWDYTVSSDEERWAHAEGYCVGFPRSPQNPCPLSGERLIHIRPRDGDALCGRAGPPASWQSDEDWVEALCPEATCPWCRAAAGAEPFRDRYHTDGHATAEEAVACHDRYLLDQQVRLHRAVVGPYPGDEIAVDYNNRAWGTRTPLCSCVGRGSDDSHSETCRFWAHVLAARAVWSGVEEARTLHHCDVKDCRAYTANTATVGQFVHFHLCDAHLTPKVVGALYKAGTSISTT